ncbi:hypothetical protein [Chondromyces crocatus]|nr:hypothetical protein [Chondromyces crocatus]
MDDSLSPAEARRRIAWARTCALDAMFFQASTPSPAQIVDGGPSRNGNERLIEYLEDWPSLNPTGFRTFTSVALGYAVNLAFIDRLYTAASPLPIQLRDEDGLALWTKEDHYKRTRPMYPIFGTQPSTSSGLPLQPRIHVGQGADCHLYRANGSTSATFYVNAYCTATPDTSTQGLVIPRESTPLPTTQREATSAPTVLAPGATLHVETGDAEAFLPPSALRDDALVVHEIRTASGRRLQVTSEQPIVQGQGRLVDAQDLDVGDTLLTLDGDEDTIVSIEVVPHQGLVHTVKPTRRDRGSSIVAAQGWFLGTAGQQDEDASYINRVLMSRSIPAEVLPQ